MVTVMSEQFDAVIKLPPIALEYITTRRIVELVEKQK